MPDLPEKQTTEIKAEVKVDNKGLSWIRRDWVVVGILFLVISVLSVTVTLTLREVNTNTVQLEDAVNTARFNSETASFCVLKVSGQVNFGAIPYTTEAINMAVDVCFEEKRTGIITPLPPIPE